MRTNWRAIINLPSEKKSAAPDGAGSKAMTAPILIVAYGNPLRSDDGVGWCAADALSRIFSRSEAEILCFHQLGPELAETVSRFRHVIFVDAATTSPGCAPGEIRIEPIQMPDKDAGSQTRFAHHLTPATVMGLARTLFGANVQAHLATVTGQNFDHGEGLSPAVSSALPNLVSKIESLVRSASAAGPLPSASRKP